MQEASTVEVMIAPNIARPGLPHKCEQQGLVQHPSFCPRQPGFTVPDMLQSNGSVEVGSSPLLIHLRTY